MAGGATGQNFGQFGSGLSRFGASQPVQRLNYTPKNYSAPSVGSWQPPPTPKPAQGLFSPTANTPYVFQSTGGNGAGGVGDSGIGAGGIGNGIGVGSGIGGIGPGIGGIGIGDGPGIGPGIGGIGGIGDSIGSIGIGDGSGIGVDASAAAAGVGGGGGGGSKIICAELYRQGRMDALTHKLDEAFGEFMAVHDPEALDGYRRLAEPIVRAMQKSLLVTIIAQIIVKPWSAEMCHQMGHGKGSIIGRCIMAVGKPVCRMFAREPMRRVA